MSKTNTNKEVGYRLGKVRKKITGGKHYSITGLKALNIKKQNNLASYFKGAGTFERRFLLDTMKICNLSSDM